jgi:DNA mismatch endonuclease, patch repair protein
MRANRRISRREVAFRRALWRAGARGYRVQSQLPGRPDLVFPRLQLAIFIHGCFWHRCEACSLPVPVANAEFWATKFEQNRRRDLVARDQLTGMGWEVSTIWEHEIRPDPTARAASLAAEIGRRRQERAG